MKIKSIELKNFRRFTDLNIEGIPETAKLVVMIGPNGCGKSSVFDALQALKDTKGFQSTNVSGDYYFKSKYLLATDIFTSLTENVKLIFHGESPSIPGEWKSVFHIRSAYRNDLAENLNSHVSQNRPLTEQRRFNRLAENDQSVASNYGRLLGLWIKHSSAHGQRKENVGKLQDEIFGKLREATAELFTEPELVLTGLGSPANNEVFQFNKGTSHGLSYQNLASGEKAALDLILDIIVAKSEFNDTVFCIDEPEAHIHTKLQGPLLEKLYDLISPNSQLWIATHSIGMVRKAQDLWHEDSDSVVFLDFGKDDSGQEHNFDGEVEITPAKPSPNLWGQTYSVALGDLSELIAFEHYVFCEGEDFDEECYQNIFKERFPVTRFISIGGRNNVVNAVSKLKGKIAKAAKVSGIVDRDRATKQEIEEAAKTEVYTLSRKSIESYLLDDEVLTKLCEHYDKFDETQNLLIAKGEILKKRISEGKSKSSDDLKPIAQDIHVAAQNALKSVNLGNSKESFMRDILAPLIQPGMKVYEKLHKDIFDE